MIGVYIGRAVPTDAEGIVNVQRDGWLTTYPNEAYGISYEQIRHRVEGEKGERLMERVEKTRARIEEANPLEATFVARQGSAVVGVASVGMEGNKYFLKALYVLSGFRGEKIGSRLLQVALDWLGPHDVFLIVTVYNHRTIALYRRFGFVETGVRVVDVRAKELGVVALPGMEMVRRQ